MEEAGAAAGAEEEAVAAVVPNPPPSSPPPIPPSFRVQAVAFSPLGDAIALRKPRRTIRFWDAATGEPLGKPIPVHEGRMGHVWSITYSPEGARTRVVTASRDATIRILDARTGELLRSPLEGHKSDVFAAVFSPDGKTLASAGKDGTIRFWDGATGDAAGALAAHAKAVYAIGFSPDGLRLASASEDGKAILWVRESLAPDATWRTVRTLDVPVESLLRRPGARHAVAFSPDGTRLATASHALRICLWNAHTGESIAPPLAAHTDPGSRESVRPSPGRRGWCQPELAKESSCRPVPCNWSPCRARPSAPCARDCSGSESACCAAGCSP